MSEQNNELNESQIQETLQDELNKQAAPAPIEDDDLKAIVESRVADEVAKAKADFKSKLDEVYAARDTVLAEKVALEEEKRQQEIKRMEEEGKHKEVAELRVAEMKAKMESLQKENTRLTRDQNVKDALRGVDFRSDLASEMAFERIVNQMVQDESGRWQHKSGVSVREFVEHFKKEEDNAFLFKAKVNSGLGAIAGQSTADTTSNKPITEMSTEEMLAHFSRQAPDSNTPFGF